MKRAAAAAGAAAWLGALVLATPAVGHPPGTRLIALPAATETSAPAGGRTLVQELGGGVRLVDLEPPESEADRQVLLAGGREIGGWPVPPGDHSRTLVAFRAGNDVVVGRRMATSMGIGIETWTVLAFRLAGAGPVRPLRFTASDWGLDAVRVDGAGLAVLATDWAWPAHGPRSGSFHFLGGWFGVEDGRLVPRGGWRARPYLFSFERERGGELHGPRPARWLRPGKAAAYPGGDPRLGQETAPRVAGRLAIAGGALTLGSGTLSLAGRRLWLADDGVPAGHVAVTHVAEGATLWPAGYVPADLTRWAGRSAWLETRGDVRVLRLAPRR